MDPCGPPITDGCTTTFSTQLAIASEAVIQVQAGKAHPTALQILPISTTAVIRFPLAAFICFDSLMAVQRSALVRKPHATTAIAIATVAKEFR